MAAGDGTMRQAINLVRVTNREIRQVRAAMQMGRGHAEEAVAAMHHLMQMGVKPEGAEELLRMVEGMKADFDLTVVKLATALALTDRIIGE